MEPETNNETVVKEVEEKSSLHRVTPLSKYLAMALFIISPFIGGWVGYQYAPEKIVEVEKVVIREVKDEGIIKIPQDKPATPYGGDIVTLCKTNRYTNDEYGFELEYPACEDYGARQNSSESGGSFQIWKVTQEEDKNPSEEWSPINSVFISVSTNPDNLSVDEFYNGNPPAYSDLVGQTMDEDRETFILNSGLVVEYFNPYVGLTGAEQHYIIDTKQGYFIEVFDRGIVFSRQEMIEVLNSIEIQ